MSTRYRIETIEGQLVCELSGVSIERAKKLGRKIAGGRKLRLRSVPSQTPAKRRSKKTPRPAPAKQRRRRARGKAGKKKSRRNPGAPSAIEIDRGARTFASWHGFSPTHETTVRAERPVPRVLAVLGEVHAIEYMSNKWTGKKARYRHVFHSPRPLMCTGPDKSRVYLHGGGYKVTERGLED